MIETWTALEIVGAVTCIVAVCAPVVYAWADRWLDRTRKENE